MQNQKRFRFGSHRPLSALSMVGVAAAVWITPAAVAASITLSSGESFPRTGTAQINKDVTLGSIDGTPSVSYSVSSADPYGRYFRLYVNGTQVYQRIVYRSASGTVNVASHMQRPGVYRITFEIRWGGYATWSLDGTVLNHVTASPVPGCALSSDADLATFQGLLGEVYIEDRILADRVTTLETRVASAKDKAAKGKQVADKIVTAKEHADAADRVIDVLTPVPYIGPVARAAGRALDRIRPPLDQAYQPAKRTRTALTNAEAALARAETALDVVLTSLGYVETTTDLADGLICDGIPCATSILTALAALGTPPAATTLASLQDANSALDQAEAYLNDAEAMLAAVTDEVLDRTNDALQALVNLLQPLNDLYDALSYEIFGYSIADILDGIDWLLDMAKAILDPIVDVLWGAIDDVVNLPDLPDFSGIVNLENLLEMPAINISISIPYTSTPDLCDLADTFDTCVSEQMREYLGCGPLCGNGDCSGGESCSTCVADCGVCCGLCGGRPCCGFCRDGMCLN